MSDSNKRRLRDAASGPGTLISQGCKVEGMLRGAGNFMINGEVDGECDVDGSVTLAEGGHWKGVIRATSVIVAGSIEGDIIAAGPVEIGDTARISGTVTGEAIAVIANVARIAVTGLLPVRFGSLKSLLRDPARCLIKKDTEAENERNANERVAS